MCDTVEQVQSKTEETNSGLSSPMCANITVLVDYILWIVKVLMLNLILCPLEHCNLSCTFLLIPSVTHPLIAAQFSELQLNERRNLLRVWLARKLFLASPG